MPIFDPNAGFKVYKGDKLIYTNAPSGSFGDVLAWFMKNDDGKPESETDKVKGLKLDAVAASDTAMEAMVNSELTMYVVTNSKAVMDAVLASKTAMDAVLASKTAMDAVLASKTAMDAVAASKTAMDAVLASKTVMDAVLASDVAIASMVCGSAEVNAAFLEWSYEHHSFSRVYQTVSKSNLFTIIYSSFGSTVISFNADYDKKFNKKPSNVICFAALSALYIKNDTYPILEGYASMTSNGVYMRGYSYKERVILSESNVNGIGINIWDIKGEKQGRGDSGHVSGAVYQVKNP